ncbi:DUF680 domain-containing protein [Mesorhizobium amorphae]|uniref:DUF680 domain-containing protein n=1 Tax=Mesorhizobium amorphae CCNWGS0123 TaxID=1082933 RepID=G6Y297_9HYPH|nr:DUF680 domain-containing protein [Mesorhizobium amorphae]ANT53396.1 hypothetical protein A6B35_27720 [Mesorhizobium amorphae CCNWGS0123]EHH14080.1 hypothetical protein MEA186_00175 [Mesorhizobium amorphae CCNWGS0123]GLR41312.1 hypothetical protein GCM10007880_18280 [Mesorhizobium amorphae]
MKKIILATVALLSASGMAFAGSDHYGSQFIPGPDSYPVTGHSSMASDNGYSIDLKSTKSIGTNDGEKALAGSSAFDKPAPGYGQGIWGR